METMKGGLWLTTMGRIVIDDHNCETFSEPGDTKLFTKEELSLGIQADEFYNKLTKHMITENLSKDETEKNPAHYCDCNKFLGHRGFCSTKCHDNHYDGYDDKEGVE